MCVSDRRSSRRRSDEVEDHRRPPGPAARCARSGRRRRGSRSRPPTGSQGNTSRGTVPQPISSICPPSTPRNGMRQAGQLDDRPLRPPRAEAAHAHRGVDLPPPSVVRLERRRRRRGGAATRSTAAGSSAPAARPTPRTCPACGWSVGRAAPVVEPAARPRCRPSSARSCSATSGWRRRYGMPSRLTTWVNRYGWASASWIISEPPLECPSTGVGRPLPRVSITTIASRRSASQPYSAAWSLSPWPRWSQAITRQPAAAIFGANTS